MPEPGGYRGGAADAADRDRDTMRGPRAVAEFAELVEPPAGDAAAGEHGTGMFAACRDCGGAADPARRDRRRAVRPRPVAQLAVVIGPPAGSRTPCEQGARMGPSGGDRGGRGTQGRQGRRRHGQRCSGDRGSHRNRGAHHARGKARRQQESAQSPRQGPRSRTRHPCISPCRFAGPGRFGRNREIVPRSSRQRGRNGATPTDHGHRTPTGRPGRPLQGAHSTSSAHECRLNLPSRGESCGFADIRQDGRTRYHIHLPNGPYLVASAWTIPAPNRAANTARRRGQSGRTSTS